MFVKFETEETKFGSTYKSASGRHDTADPFNRGQDRVQRNIGAERAAADYYVKNARQLQGEVNRFLSANRGFVVLRVTRNSQWTDLPYHNSDAWHALPTWAKEDETVGLVIGVIKENTFVPRWHVGFAKTCEWMGFGPVKKRKVLTSELTSAMSNLAGVIRTTDSEEKHEKI